MIPSRPRILLVDDEPDILETLGFTLSLYGYEVYSAPNGREAIRIAETHGPMEAVISDYRMPDMTGLRLHQLLQERFSSSCPLILSTGQADVCPQEAYDAGIAALLIKPYELNLLRQILSQVIAPLEDKWLGPLSELVGSDTPALSLRLTPEKLGRHLGRGGILVSGTGLPLRVSTRVFVKLELARPEPGLAEDDRRIEFIGRVRWVRMETQSEERFMAGLEFERIAESHRTWLIEQIQRVKPHSFIPMRARQAKPLVVDASL